ncbi:MAG: hypothetical protein M3O30_11900 [Planctomycetota bacterium]|nr:hypothetical protein [Planctomycetota bacterium]
MKIKRISAALAAALAGGGAFGAGAGQSLASTIVPSGGTAGGWEITYPAGIMITDVGTGSDTTIDLIKNATFHTNEGLSITFTQVSPAAVAFVTIDSEQITNNTSGDWAGFQFLLISDGGGGGAGFASASQTFTNIGPFTTQTFSASTIDLTGGTLGSGSTASWGGPGGGSLVIQTKRDANSVTNFDLKEIPSTDPIVALPSAAFGSVFLFAVLGLVSSATKIARQPAD